MRITFMGSAPMIRPGQMNTWREREANRKVLEQQEKQ
jgi:hypothetical protein